MSHPLLSVTDHRPWPLPSRAWIMFQQWSNLLFMHWPVAPERVRPLVPSQLPLDTFDGAAWLTIAPFEVSAVRPWGIASMPGAGRFPELNVRTYVRLHDKSGVSFSLDAASWLAVVGARLWYKLPYLHARMAMHERDGRTDYDCVRTDQRARQAEFKAQYGPTGPVRRTSPHTVEHWLTERYCLFSHARGAVYCADIHHEPWPLQPASTEIAVNTMAHSHGLPPPSDAPILQFAKRLDVLVWGPERVPTAVG